jgi:hypothetical protein
MTVATGKPKQSEKSAVANSREPAQGQSGGSSDMQTNRSNGVGGPAAKPSIEKGARNHLGGQLKASYDELVRQPVPDRFRQLLEELERREKSK